MWRKRAEKLQLATYPLTSPADCMKKSQQVVATMGIIVILSIGFVMVASRGLVCVVETWPSFLDDPSPRIVVSPTMQDKIDKSVSKHLFEIFGIDRKSWVPFASPKERIEMRMYYFSSLDDVAAEMPRAFRCGRQRGQVPVDVTDLPEAFRCEPLLVVEVLSFVWGSGFPFGVAYLDPCVILFLASDPQQSFLLP